MSVSLLMDLLSYCKVPPSVNQVELHPRNTQKSLVAFCQSKGNDNAIYALLIGQLSGKHLFLSAINMRDLISFTLHFLIFS